MKLKIKRFTFDIVTAAGLPAVLMPGDHVFPFMCQLPMDLPSSLESPQGYIRYHAMAIVEGTELDGATAHVMFTVNAIVNLNENSKAKVSPVGCPGKF
jgi:Arrestin (or S-antigen), N-terminal domain